MAFISRQAAENARKAEPVSPAARKTYSCYLDNLEAVSTNDPVMMKRIGKLRQQHKNRK